MGIFWWGMGEQTSVDQQSHTNQQPAIDCSLTRPRFCKF